MNRQVTPTHGVVSILQKILIIYDQAREGITPDSQKSTLDKAKETFTGKSDDVAGTVQPEGQKSTTQKIGDSTKDTFNQGAEQVSLRLVILTWSSNS
jgi:hypothetical protein